MSKLDARKQVLVKIHQVATGFMDATSVAESVIAAAAKSEGLAVPRFLKYLTDTYQVVIDNQGEGFCIITKRPGVGDGKILKEIVDEADAFCKPAEPISLLEAIRAVVRGESMAAIYSEAQMKAEAERAGHSVYTLVRNLTSKYEVRIRRSRSNGDFVIERATKTKIKLSTYDLTIDDIRNRVAMLDPGKSLTIAIDILAAATSKKKMRVFDFYDELGSKYNVSIRRDGDNYVFTKREGDVEARSASKTRQNWGCFS